MKLLKSLKVNDKSYPKRIGLVEEYGVIKYAIEEYNKTPKYSAYFTIFSEYKANDYIRHGVKFLEPMNAKEVTDTEKLDMMFNSEDYLVEDKLDGTRATIHFKKDPITGDYTTRVFSRRVSVKTGWLSENTDSLPQFRLMSIPELDGTVIDGELRMPGYEFKEVSSTLNCTWDEAIRRQIKLNFIHLFAFDILMYKGEDITNKPLIERKKLLKEVVTIIKNHYLTPCIEYLPHYDGLSVDVEIDLDLRKKIWENKSVYPTLYNEIIGHLFQSDKSFVYRFRISRKAYYEYVVLTGGEGVMIKPKNGVYSCGTRKDAFMKVKKFMTRECVILGFTAPTKEYKGKYPDPNVWKYWEVDLASGGCEVIDTENEPDVISDIKQHPEAYTPVSKYYAEGWVGNIIAGVLITDEEAEKLPKKCKGDITYLNNNKYLIVAEISGYDEPTRAFFTEHQDELLESVVEIKANDLFKDTGRLRHPRFLRLRPDKSYIQCTFKDHIFA